MNAGRLTLTAILTAALFAPLPLTSASGAARDAEAHTSVEVEGLSVAAADDPVSITLPGAVTNDEVDIALVPAHEFKGNGEAVLNTTIAGSTISTFATDGGTQTLIEIPSAGSASEYQFPLSLPDDGEAVLLDDGSVALFDGDGNSLGGFHTPWAYDANGEAVPTSFHIEDDTLIQTVDLSSTTAYPIIADPDRGTEWWGVWTRYTKSETKSLATAVKSSNATMVKDMMTAACAFAPGWTGGACALFIQAKWYLTMQPAIDAAAKGKCFALNIPRFVPGVSMNGTIVNCTR